MLYSFLQNWPLRRDFVLLTPARQKQLWIYARIVDKYFASAYFINKIFTNDVLGVDDLALFESTLNDEDEDKQTGLPLYLRHPRPFHYAVDANFVLKVIIPAYRFAAVPLAKSMILYRGDVNYNTSDFRRSRAGDIYQINRPVTFSKSVEVAQSFTGVDPEDAEQAVIFRVYVPSGIHVIDFKNHPYNRLQEVVSIELCEMMQMTDWIVDLSVGRNAEFEIIPGKKLPLRKKKLTIKPGNHLPDPKRRKQTILFL